MGLSTPRQTRLATAAALGITAALALSGCGSSSGSSSSGPKTFYGNSDNGAMSKVTVNGKTVTIIDWIGCSFDSSTQSTGTLNGKTLVWGGGGRWSGTETVSFAGPTMNMADNGGDDQNYTFTQLSPAAAKAKIKAAHSGC